MTILQISSAEGFPIGDSSTQSAIMEMIMDDTVEVFRLRPGEHDLTPANATRDGYHHDVIVHSDGTATYRAQSLDGSHAIAISNGNDTALKSGGLVLRIPQEACATAIKGRLPNDPQLRIFEALMYSNES